VISLREARLGDGMARGKLRQQQVRVGDRLLQGAILLLDTPDRAGCRCLLTRNAGGLDRDKAARAFLSDYPNGTLGRISLEEPGAREEVRS